MAILSGHKKEKEYIADQNGDHTLVSKWTHADSVEMPNGQTLSEFTFDDNKVSQIQSDSGISGKYNVLLSETSNSGTTLTERARKTSQLYWYSNAKLLAVYDTSNSVGVGIKTNDVVLSGTDNTWDGEHTSLKDALAAKGTSNLVIGTTADTAMAGNTNVANVTQTQSNDNNGNFEVLFSGTADNTTRAEGSRKSKYLTYNPSVNRLVLGTTSNGSASMSASSTGNDLDIKTTENNKVYASATIAGASLIVKSNIAEPHIGVTHVDNGVTKIINLKPSDITLSNNTWDGTNTSLKNALAAKQGTLTPGTNISIVSGVISATDTTYNDFDGSVHGLVPVPSSGDSAKFLKGDGTWATPTDTTYSDFAGSTHGLVPAVITQAGKFLKDDGTWDTPSTSLATLSDVDLTSLADGQILKYDSANSEWVNANEVSYSDFAGSTHGLVPAVQTQAGKFLKDDGTWGTPSTGSSSLSGLSDVTLTTPTDGQVLKYDATNNVWVNDTDSGANDAVTQTATDSTDAIYEVLFSNTADNTTRTEGARKSSNLTYNPSDKCLSIKEIETQEGVDYESYIDMYPDTINMIDDLKNSAVMIYIDSNGGHYYMSNGNNNTALSVDTNDIRLLGTGDTWDGTHTSLKDAIAASGGGGTTVIANPSGTATDDLTKIQIGTTIYDIPGGGSGSGGGGTKTRTLLLDTVMSSTTDYALADSIDNYDSIEMWTCVSGNESTEGEVRLIDAQGLKAFMDSNRTYTMSGYSSGYCNFKIIDGTTFRVARISGLTIYKVYGIKYSSGSQPVELTKAQYDALTSEQKNDPTKIYFVTDYEPASNNGDRINTQAAVNMGRNTHIAKLSNTGTDIVHT